MNNICILRNTFGDRSSFLKLCLEYQNDIKNNNFFDTWIFIDPNIHNITNPSYNSNFFNQYFKIVFEQHKGRKSWYNAVKYIFHNYSFDYVLSIEDDVILSYDYIDLCNEIINSKILEDKSNILYFHPGAWQQPKGDVNKIVYSGASSRSILISRNKFKVIQDFVEKNDVFSSKSTGNDQLISKILQEKNMKTISPEYNRHAHIGVYGWSSNGVHADSRGRISILDSSVSDNDFYIMLKDSCFNKEKLLKLNQNKNPDYFWNFNPKISFTTLRYEL